MAKLTKEDVLKLARLSRLHLTDEEVAKYQKEIESILSYVDQLSSLKLDNVEPTYQVTGLRTVTRRDEVVDYGTDREKLLKNAPNTKNGHIVTRRIL